MQLALTNRAKVLVGAVVLIGAAAAAWFLYGEEWLAGPPAPPPMAAKPKPAAPAAAAPEAPKPAPIAEAPKPPAEVPKPVAEAPKPAVAEAPKPAAPAVVPVAQAPAPKDETVKPKRATKKKDSTQAKALAREAAGEPAKASSDMAPIPAAIPVQAAVSAPAESAVTPPAPVRTAAAAPARAPRAAPASAPAPVGNLRFNDLVTAVLYRDPDAVDALLAFGKWPDKGDSRGMTPLMYAAMVGDAQIAETLLQAGANPNLPGPGGDTALSIARERKDMGMQALLRRHGGR